MVLLICHLSIIKQKIEVVLVISDPYDMWIILCSVVIIFAIYNLLNFDSSEYIIFRINCGSSVTFMHRNSQKINTPKRDPGTVISEKNILFVLDILWIEIPISSAVLQLNSVDKLENQTKHSPRYLNYLLGVAIDSC